MKSLAGTVLATGVVAMALTGCASFTSTTYHEDHAYDVPGGQLGKLKVKLDSDNVEIVGTDATKISVRERLSYTKNRKPTAAHTVDGGTLTLGYTCPGGITIGVNTCSVAYQVQIPRGLSVEAHNDSGNITLNGVGGTVDASTSSGDITGTDLRGTQATLNADSGHIRLTGVAGSLQAKASSGDIDGVDLRGGKVNADADSGQVSLKFAKVPANVDVKASSGSIRLWLPGTQSYAVDATADSGHKSIRIPLDQASPRKIKAIADSGDITITPAG